MFICHCWVNDYNVRKTFFETFTGADSEFSNKSWSLIPLSFSRGSCFWSFWGDHRVNVSLTPKSDIVIFAWFEFSWVDGGGNGWWQHYLFFFFEDTTIMNTVVWNWLALLWVLTKLCSQQVCVLSPQQQHYSWTFCQCIPSLLTKGSETSRSHDYDCMAAGGKK